jgi:hypothetical protein
MRAGDIGFCFGSPSIIDRAITLGEWLRFRRGSKYSHVFTLDQKVGNDWQIIEARSHGVQNIRLLSELKDYTIVPSPLTQSGRLNQLSFLRAQLGKKYGFFTIGSIITTLILPSFINVMLPDTWICSALAGEGLRAGGWLHNWPDVYTVIPAQLYEALQP